MQGEPRRQVTYVFTRAISLSVVTKTLIHERTQVLLGTQVGVKCLNMSVGPISS